ncbi:MAG: AraC family transcriptional regulator [Cocleimonas sp.]
MNKVNKAEYSYADDLGGLELLQARYHSQRFSRHVHEGYCIGVIESGAQRFFRSGENHIAAKDSIILVNADQVHDGYKETEEGWSYRAMYPLPEMLGNIAAEFHGQRKDAPWFSESVVSDPYMAEQLRFLFSLLNQSDNQLHRETVCLGTIAELLQRHGNKRNILLGLGNESLAVKRVRDYIDSYYSENISMQQLAKHAQLSPFYLARLFQKTVGLPPHAYQIQRRLQKAKQLIHHGVRLSDVAVDCGFTDQSHLSRHFKRSQGVAPGAYQKMIHV